MSVQLETISGVIELKDDFTSQIGLAEAALHQFTKTNQESLVAVAGAAGLITAAFAATAVAVAELGKKGADVHNVEVSLDHFAGSAENAHAIMDKLRASTLHTVEDFDLSKQAVHLLATGVSLTADQFGVLGAAAEDLHHRGMSTKEGLDLVSDALVTGRTRGLAMALGVADITGAEEKYAKQLGITKDQLNSAGVIEAKRQAIMELLNKTVKDQTFTTRDFGEQIKAAEVGVGNFIDEVGKAIATSPALAAGMKAIEDAVKQAFGGDNTELIASLMEGIKQGVIYAIDFAQAGVEAARVFNVAWSAVKTIILGTEMAVTAIAQTVVDVTATILKFAAGLPGASDSLKQMADTAKDTSKYLEDMTMSLAKDTAEAAKGVTGHSEFDKTLDKLGGTLMNVKDAVENASASLDKSNDSGAKATETAKTLAASNAKLAQEMINRQKIEDELWKIESKSITETTQVWNQYFALRSTHGISAYDAQKRAIQSWFDDEVSKLDDSDRNWKVHYDALKAVAGEKLQDLEVDWKTLQDKSIDSLQHTADVARNTYNEMAANASHFTRDALDEQLKKVHETQDAVRGLGADTQAAMAAAQAATQAQNDKLAAQKKAAEDAAAANRALGGSFTYDISTKEGIDQYRQMNPAASITWSDEQIKAYAAKGGTIEGLIKSGVINPYGNMKGFADGGTVDVITGERGPEVARVPLGTTFFGSRPTPSNGGDTYTLNFSVNGTGMDVYNFVKDRLMRDLKSSRKFGAA